MPLAIVPSLFAPLTPSAAGDAHELPPGMESCVTCGRPAGTPYCPHCGERRAADRVYTLGALAAEVWDHVTPADGRVLRSMWTLVRRPGALTAAYMTGVRQPFLAPLGVFFAVNGAYFVFVSATHVNTFTTPLTVHVSGTLYKQLAVALVRRRLAERHVTFAAYARRFDATAAEQAKSLVVGTVPVFALLVAAVHPRRERNVLRHLTFALHAAAVFLVVLMAVGVVSVLPLTIAIRGFGARLTPQDIDNDTTLGMVAVLATWLTFAFRRAYSDGRRGSTLKAILVALLTFPVVVSAYRALLFFTTFWAT